MNGILGTWDLLANVKQAIYYNSYDTASVVIANLCNKGGGVAYVSIAVSSSATNIDDKEWIVWRQGVDPKTTYERMSIMVGVGKYLVVRSTSADVNAICYGVTNGLVSPTGISVNLGTAPAWSTSATLPITYAGDESTSIQLVATDEEGEAITYSVTSGSMPTGLSLSSAGLITGTPDVTGYSSGLPDTTNTVGISAIDSRSNATPRTFNIIKRWADGLTQGTAATSAQAIYNLSATYRGSGASNWFWIKGATESTAQARRMYCSMNGAGYMLWYHYRDPYSGSLSISDPGNSGTTYTLTSTSAMFMYALPAEIANNVSYLYLNSDVDTTPTTPAFANFKYAVQLNADLRLWLTTTKDQTNFWGLAVRPGVLPTSGDPVGVPTNIVKVTSPSSVNYRYGSVIGEIQYGHNNGGGNEVDGLSFRNSSGTGALRWTTASHIWDYSGWAAIDASTPTNVNSGWGSSGADESAGWNKQNHLYAWIK